MQTGDNFEINNKIKMYQNHRFFSGSKTTQAVKLLSIFSVTQEGYVLDWSKSFPHKSRGEWIYSLSQWGPSRETFYTALSAEHREKWGRVWSDLKETDFETWQTTGQPGKWKGKGDLGATSAKSTDFSLGPTAVCLGCCNLWIRFLFNSAGTQRLT